MNSIDTLPSPTTSTNVDPADTDTVGQPSNAANVVALQQLVTPTSTLTPEQAKQLMATLSFKINPYEDSDEEGTPSTLGVLSTVLGMTPTTTTPPATTEGTPAANVSTPQINLSAAEEPQAIAVTITTSDDTNDLAHADNSDTSNLGDNILQSLGVQSSATITTTAPAIEAAGIHIADRIAQIESYINEMADSILVTDPLHNQKSQVNIKLADNILPGTELQMWRSEGGQLNVNFATTSLHSAQLLVDAAQLLAQRLNERLSLPEPAIVSVQSNNDGGMPEDGRSRQHYTPYDLAAVEQVA